MAGVRRRCKGVTRGGKRCKNYPLAGTPFCIAHSPKETQEKAGFGGAQPGSGRPRLPRPHEVLREKIEANIDRWLQPLEDALEAERAIVVGAGEFAEIEHVPDHKIRLQAVRDAHDRVYGKPKQQVELGGSDVPITTEVVHVDDREAAAAAHEFLRRIAGGTDPGG